ncbi:TPA: hypothetical protein ACMY2T_002585, partial [Legionella pneumophila]
PKSYRTEISTNDLLLFDSIMDNFGHFQEASCDQNCKKIRYKPVYIGMRCERLIQEGKLDYPEYRSQFVCESDINLINIVKIL